MAESIAIVTGGTKGLGRATSLGLAARGYDVRALYRADDRAAADLDAAARAMGTPIECLRCDFSREEPSIFEPGLAVKRVVLVHAAATFVPAPIHLTDNDDVRRHFDVAVKGLLACVRPVLRILSATSGSTIVGVSSRAAIGAAAPTPGFAAYAAAKAAMAMLIAGLAREYGKRGLRTFCFAPGFMATDLTAAWPEAIRQRAAADSQTTPTFAAERIVNLIHDPSIAAAGEVHE